LGAVASRVMVVVVVGVDVIEVDDEDEDEDEDDDGPSSVVSRTSKFSESPPFISNTNESSLK